MPTKKPSVAPQVPTKSVERPLESAQGVHQKPQKSQTLHRAVVQRPAKQPVQPKLVHQKSPLITRFNAQTVNEQPKTSPAVAQPDAEPSIHPAVAKALANTNRQSVAQSSNASPQQSSKELKEALIKERLAEVETTGQGKKKEKRSLFARQPKLTTILTTSLAILLLGGYLTFINLPNISMRVASTRAGISANFPSYKPDGYSFQGPITYAPGEVAINFKSNTNNTSFTLKQQNSNWDSQAVLDNFVNKHTDNYLTYQEQGLTIYSFDNKAAWTNGGLLYSLEGNAQLSSEQILRLATSM
jgi:hypothetical protein